MIGINLLWFKGYSINCRDINVDIVCMQTVWLIDPNFNLMASMKYQSDLDVDQYKSKASSHISKNF